MQPPGTRGPPASTVTPMTDAPTADSADTAEGPRGVDVPRVTEWFQAHAPEVEPPLDFELIAGGRSNLPFRVTDAADHAWVLRRPPLGQVLATAHDMSREYRVIPALRDTDVPVAPALAFCADEAVNDRPFYVMGFVDGVVLHTAGHTERLLPAHPARRRAAETMVDALSALHAVDVDAVEPRHQAAERSR